jgi:hypothetical protein
MAPGLARRLLALLAIAVLAGVATSALLGGGDDGGPGHLVPGSGHAPGSGQEEVDPLAYTPGRERRLVAAAERGHAHVLYAKSPGGARASAQRTARYRRLVEAVARADDLDPDTLEAMILLESAGRPTAVADPRLEGAVGLTQILAETGRNLLRMRVDPVAARRLSRSIRRAVRRGRPSTAERLRARRRLADERFDPAKAIAATGRYLVFAREQLGRDDLAVASYHMGVGNLQRALRDFGDDEASYARLFFDSTPLRHADAYRRLAALGDDSSTYLWRVGAAREIMRLYRRDPARLDRISRRQTAKNSAEEVLHPASRTDRFATPAELRRAYADGTVVPLDVPRLRRAGVRVDPQMGELAGRLKRDRSTYRGLRPEALALLVYLGTGTREISGARPLLLSSSVRDQRYQDLLVGTNVEATAKYSLHTTGFAFDILRTYRSRGQALAFQFLLDRLQSLDLIAWVREPAAIHVTVSGRARELLGLLR